MHQKTAARILPLLLLAWTLPAWSSDQPAPTTCKDGTTSNATGRGACSGHGGVQTATAGASSSAAATTPSATPPAASTSAQGSSATPASATSTPKTDSSKAAASSGNAAPSGATAKCKDGTYSKAKSHSGACSHHGGVDQWLDSGH
ncbi:MAG TPA: DUF3761 domain-containing protein [Steroidobacteraceae bacterium]|nr:DUF3761 domain-containing protein [Steroidobacteraceae bacterium]